MTSDRPRSTDVIEPEIILEQAGGASSVGSNVARRSESSSLGGTYAERIGDRIAQTVPAVRAHLRYGGGETASELTLTSAGTHATLSVQVDDNKLSLAFARHQQTVHLSDDTIADIERMVAELVAGIVSGRVVAYQELVGSVISTMLIGMTPRGGLDSVVETSTTMRGPGEPTFAPGFVSYDGRKSGPPSLGEKYWLFRARGGLGGVAKRALIGKLTKGLPEQLSVQFGGPAGGNASGNAAERYSDDGAAQDAPAHAPSANRRLGDGK